MTRAVLKNPYLVGVLATAILVLGLYTYPKIPKDLLPIFETSAVQIVTFYPGMPPEIMEKDIMSRMQRWTGQSVGIEHQEAKAMTGVCIVKDFLSRGHLARYRNGSNHQLRDERYVLTCPQERFHQCSCPLIQPRHCRCVWWSLTARG